jgi:putative oxidoreductase
VNKRLWSARCATLLGVIFLYAAWGKIQDPGTFAELIYHYKMGPYWGANLVAVTLPWIELFAGLCLITGLWQRAAALLTGGMLVFFIAMIAVAWIRPDVNIKDCGCFADGAPRTPLQVLTEDALMLVLVIPSWFWARRNGGAADSPISQEMEGEGAEA